MSPGYCPQRSEQVNTLILNANDLVGVLNDRRQAIVSLLANTSAGVAGAVRRGGR